MAKNRSFWPSKPCLVPWNWKNAVKPRQTQELLQKRLDDAKTPSERAYQARQPNMMIRTSNWLNCDGIYYTKYRRVIFCSVENVNPNPAVFILVRSPIWSFDSLSQRSFREENHEELGPSQAELMDTAYQVWWCRWSLWLSFAFLRFYLHSNRARCGSFGRRWGRLSQRRTGLRWSRFGKHGKDGSLIHDDPWNESKICQAKHVMKSSVFVCLFNDSKSSSVLLLLKDSSILLQKWHQIPDSSQMFLKDAFFFQDECLGSIAA